MTDRDLISNWLMTGVVAVEPERLTEAALTARSGRLTVLAIGKAAAGMCRGAARVADDIDGLCITDRPDHIPPGVELMIGDHPVPSVASLAAGRRALEMAPHADLALVSGGGSSLCEVPADGLDLAFVAMVSERLLQSGISIVDTNLVRSHISAIKGGGLGPIDTYVLSDVADAGPEVVSSGLTVGSASDPDRALEILERIGVEIDVDRETALRRRESVTSAPATIEVIGDGRLAAHAVASAAADSGLSTLEWDEWIVGNYKECLERFIASAPPGVTVAAGEPSVPATGGGKGGRNTHTALTAATMIVGTEIRFAALATDGTDGTSNAAGGIVDGTTVARGGDPANALTICDSASYLRATGDLIETGPTGTNVADLWLIWKPPGGPQPILTV